MLRLLLLCGVTSTLAACFSETDTAADAGGSTDASTSSTTAPASSAVDDQTSGTAGDSSAAGATGDGSSTSEGAESSSTGEVPTPCETTDDCPEGEWCPSNPNTCRPIYDVGHCDMTCPAGDAIQPSAEQAGGTFPGCYCAAPCESDEGCNDLEHCDAFFGRCTIACMGERDCYTIDPGLSCTLWWNSAEDFVHFCAYFNEDAP